MEAPFKDQRLISVTDQELKRFTKSLDVILCISDLFGQLRNVYKYSENEEEIAQAEKWRGILVSLLEDRGVDLDDLLL